MAVCLILFGCFVGCSTETGEPAEADWFTEVTESWGLPGRTDDWPRGTHAVPEITAVGVGIFDADGDGDLDIWQRRIPRPDRPGSAAADVLWRQEAPGHFVAWPDRGMEDPGFAQAAAFGDPDGDGDLDLYAANLGTDRYYENLGEGNFRDATAESGLGDDGWSTGAVFCDPDGDGDQDLYVIRYLDYDPERQCLSDAGKEDYCGPAQFPGASDLYYENQGDGQFLSTGQALGLTDAATSRSAKGLGVICTDLTGDGRADIYVANDGEPNHLWSLAGDGTWSERGMAQGLAVNRYGAPESSMGIAAADLDDDGELDLMLTHLSGQNNTLYQSRNQRGWDDSTPGAGMAAEDWSRTGFGCTFADFDGDGDDDLVVADGRVFRDPDKRPEDGDLYWGGYAEPDLLFENTGTGRFQIRRGDPFEAQMEISRGLIAADLDGDGDDDLVVSTHRGDLRLFRNDRQNETPAFEVEASWNGSPALGAGLLFESTTGKHRAVLMTTRSYASAGPPVVRIFSIAGQPPVSVVVTWPDGSRERFALSEPGRTLLEYGTGASL